MNHLQSMKMPTQRRSAPKKTVQFQRLVVIHFIELIDKSCSSSSDLWYSKKDYIAMRFAINRAVDQANNRLVRVVSPSLYNNSGPKQDKDVCITGIEDILSSSAYVRRRACRRTFLRALFAEQTSQRYARKCEPDKLASISQEYSKSEARRARMIGSLQSR